MKKPLKLAIDLRPIMDEKISGVSVYTHSMIEEFLQMPELKIQLFYQNSKRIEHLHKKYPNTKWHKKSNFLFHLKSALRTQKLPSNIFAKMPDLIWLPDRRPFYKTSIPVVMTIHDFVPKYFFKTLSWRAKIWHLLFPTNKLLKNVNGVLCPSFSVEKDLPRKTPKRVIYAGVKIPPGLKTNKKEKEFTLFIAPKDPRKGLTNFFRLAGDFPKDNFVWIGVKEKDYRFAKSYKKIPQNIKILKNVSEELKWKLLKKAGALLALSEYEGFDIPVLEAVEAKCPVILSDINVHRELYKNGSFFRSYEDLYTQYLKYKQGSIKVPQKRGIYTWENASKEALLFFASIIRNKNR